MEQALFSLQDKYLKRDGAIAINGIQALIRLPMEQYRRDANAGIRTGTYVSGYQGSPLGELDKHMSLNKQLLEACHVKWEAGINEDVAATAVYGTQLLSHFPHSQYDGVIGIWYGKNPGFDRSCDAFRHGNFVGTSPNGAMLALVGDDPACKSSTLPSDSLIGLYDLSFPQLFPGTPSEVIDFGLHAIAMSRYSGLWCALKIVTNVADGGEIVTLPNFDAALPVIPEFTIDGTPFIHQQDWRLFPPYTVEMEKIMLTQRMGAAQAYARANRLDKIRVESKSDSFGLVAGGKTFYDLRHALQLLGFRDDLALQQAGIRLYQLGMIAPIEPTSMQAFTHGLEHVVVVEEKRGFIEMQLRNLLFNDATRPHVWGKQDDQDQPLFPMYSELDSTLIAQKLAPLLQRILGRADLTLHYEHLQQIQSREYTSPEISRIPYFCSGCPHNRSTKMHDEELSGGGIGCHSMALYMNRGVTWLTQMGGEGAPWLGISPFTDKDHMFQNVGDGTFFHSASKSLEACIAGGVNITFRILYNAAVAMTGGQAVKGVLTPIQLAKQLKAIGAKQISIVSEFPEHYAQSGMDAGISVHDREEYPQVLDQLRQEKGVTIIIYDQQCAAEKRRDRKRGKLETPRQRVHINASVCEGCGDCSVQSNCLSVVPLQTDYGRKTTIEQTSCNLDYSCLKGDCPAFATVELPSEDVLLPKVARATEIYDGLLEPKNKVGCADPYRVLMVGIGGSGVVTVDALLVTAALLDGKYAVHLDQTGLSQKGGAVLSHLILTEKPVSIASKISVGEANLALAFDLLATTTPDNLGRFQPNHTAVVGNTMQSYSGQMIGDAHREYPSETSLTEQINRYTKQSENIYLDASKLSEGLFGDQMPANLFMVGVAYQQGLLPLSAQSIEAAIEANGVAAKTNIQAFRWGRKYVLDPQFVKETAQPEPEEMDGWEKANANLSRWAPHLQAEYEKLKAQFPQGKVLQEILAPRIVDLILYQNPAYAQSYLDLVKHVVEGEKQKTAGRTELGETFARWHFKLMAYKDEYEVARLWLQDSTWNELQQTYQGRIKRYVHLHPPLLRKLGLQRKLRIGQWIMPLFKMLYAMRGLRGGTLDWFGRTAHRQKERSLIQWHRQITTTVLAGLTHENHQVALELLSAPDKIRGYEDIKEKTIAETMIWSETMLDAFKLEEVEKSLPIAG